MSTLDDGAVIAQAQRNDPRLTRMYGPAVRCKRVRRARR
jgi:hypothetical protein